MKQIDKKIIEEIKKEALENHVPIIMDETLEKIIDIMNGKKLGKILEIGTAVGYSAICFYQFLNENGKIDTIEIEEEKVKKANENIMKLGLEEYIQVIHGDAMEVLPTLNDQYDIIFIDASKSKYPKFLIQAIRLSRTGTIIFADNVLYKGYVLGEYHKHKQRTAVRNLREFIKEITENNQLDTKILEVGDGLAISTVTSI